jgi:hypothetical protein
MEIKDFKKIKLHWIDILGDSGWHSKKELKDMECSLCTSLCYLFYKDKNKVITFASFEADKTSKIISYGDCNVYPAGCIKKIEYI